MNAWGIAFLVASSVLMLVLPRRYAVLPLLFSVIYMTRGQVVEIGPAHFTIPRMVIAFGLLRVLLRGERLEGGLHVVDKLVLAWGALLMATSAFHTEDAWLFRAGLVWTELGSYFLIRILVRDIDDVVMTLRALGIAMIPIALAMLVEKSSGSNAFGALGGVNVNAAFRDGQYRASGPFAHPILAGTVGAFLVGAAMAIGKRYPASAVFGAASGAAIVYASTSGGPILTMGAILLGRWLWVARHHMKTVRRLFVAGLVALDLVMQDPVYFLVARIDITGGNHGYFRAQLIRSAINHFSEWWAVGTDVTRHWMPSGITANARHTDITNHFLAMGVMGGVLLMLLFVSMVAWSFRDVGRALVRLEEAPVAQQKLVWMLGVLLFAFVTTFFAISLFDQSVIFFYLILATIQAAVSQRQFEQMPAPAAPKGPPFLDPLPLANDVGARHS